MPLVQQVGQLGTPSVFGSPNTLKCRRFIRPCLKPKLYGHCKASTSPIIHPMWDEHYYAFANLVRRPMRRWWAKRKYWWLCGIALLIAALAIVQDNRLRLFTNPQGALSSQHQMWLDISGVLLWTGKAATIGVALLCATNVIRLIDRISIETLTFSASSIRTYKYKLALIHCWPALLIPFLLIIFSNFLLKYCAGSANTTLLMINGNAHYHLQDVIWVVWIVAIAVVTTGTRWQVWALFIGGPFAQNVLAYLFPAQTIAFIIPFPRSSSVSFSDLEATLCQGLGLFLVYFMFSLFLWNRIKWANIICLVYAFILLLYGIDASFGHVFLDSLIRAGYLMEGGMEPVKSLTARSADGIALKVYFGRYIVEYPAGPDWTMVPLLIRLFWLFFHYFAFSWLLRWNVPRTLQDET